VLDWFGHLLVARRRLLLAKLRDSGEIRIMQVNARAADTSRHLVVSQNPMAWWVTFAIVAVAVTTAACGGDSSRPTGPSPTPASCVLPAQPTALRIVATGSSITLTWVSPTNVAVSDYLLEVGNSPGASNADSRTVSGTSFTLTNVPTGTYYARVKARNACGVGAVSSEASVVVSSASGGGGGGSTGPISLYGGRNYDVYLGCFDCNEFASNSVHNSFGNYGSRFSSTSIWNHFSDYGSEFSTNSACNDFASNPPRLFDTNGRSYGELTLNQFRSSAIKDADIVRWLRFTVCERER
jgi:hypothetical protein